MFYFFYGIIYYKNVNFLIKGVGARIENLKLVFVPYLDNSEECYESVHNLFLGSKISSL